MHIVVERIREFQTSVCSRTGLVENKIHMDTIEPQYNNNPSIVCVLLVSINNKRNSELQVTVIESTIKYINLFI